MLVVALFVVVLSTLVFKEYPRASIILYTDSFISSDATLNFIYVQQSLRPLLTLQIKASSLSFSKNRD